MPESVQMIEAPDKGYWRMRNGEQILITQMSDSHLLNSIKMVQRAARKLCDETKNAAQQFESICDNTWSFTIAQLEDFIERGTWKDFLPPVYFDLVKEYKTRHAGLQ